VIAHGDQVWHVEPVAEWPPHASAWQLTLAFRAAAPAGRRAVWASFPIEATSKASLYLQAERIPDSALTSALAERLR
jgi:hypothetical protein